MPGMEDVKAIVSGNLVRLRKANGLTQADLAKLINYSDKAISRWEKGEVVPDLETIYALSEVYHVPVSAITEKAPEKEETDAPVSDVRQKVLSQIFLLCEIWFIIVAVYVYLHLMRQMNLWQLFIWGVPACALAIWLFNRREQAGLLLFISASVFNWSLITCVYLHLLHGHPWYLYFIGLPLQGLILIRYLFNYKQNLKKIRLHRKEAEPQQEEPQQTIE